jgi:hypothetical protein
MEYGEAITAQAFDRAVKIARQRRESRGEPLPKAALEAVAQAYCVCVTDGEDAAEHRFSDVHRKLIDDVIERVTLLDHERPNGSNGG